MTSEPVGVEPMVVNYQQAELVRAAVAREHDVIVRAIGAAVHAVSRGMGRDLLRQRTEEVIAEAVRRALEHPASYDPNRPIVAWLVGIARNVLYGEFRAESRQPMRVDLDEAAWNGVLGVIDQQMTEAMRRLDVERMLMQLSAGDRQAIELRYLQELEGDQLAQGLGVSNPGAARARVYRALRTLRNLFASEQSEVNQ